MQAKGQGERAKGGAGVWFVGARAAGCKVLELGVLGRCWHKLDGARQRQFSDWRSWREVRMAPVLGLSQTGDCSIRELHAVANFGLSVAICVKGLVQANRGMYRGVL